MSEFRKISNRQLLRWKFWFWVERKANVKLQHVDREIGAIRVHNAKMFADGYKPSK